MARLTAATTGLRIKEAYTRAGLNRNRLSKMTGIDYAQIIEWEKGRAVPRTDSLEAVASVTGYTVDELLGRTEVIERDEPAAFTEFVTRYGSTLVPPLSDTEKRSLLGNTFHRPSADKYYAVLMLMRDGMPPEVARDSEEATAAAIEKGRARGVRPRVKRDRRSNGKGSGDDTDR